MNLPNREREKKNLVNLSDEELAQLSPEELEEVKKAKANLLSIKKTDKEVDAMASQEEFQKAVQQVAEEHNLTMDEAEVIVKKKMGMGSGTTSDLAMLAQFFQPKENPMVDAINKAIADRIGGALFPERPPGGGDGNPPGGGQPNNITAAITHAKEAGVQSIYLPDGTQVMLQAKAEDGSIAKSIEDKIRGYLDSVITQRLPNVFSPPADNKGTGAALPSGILDPQLARLFYEDKWKDRDREAEDARSKARDEVIGSIAASIGAGLSPEGFEKIKGMIKQGGPAGALSQGKQEGKPTGRMIRAVCWKCGKPFRYDEGEEALCPYCQANQKVQCPRCEAIFTPTNAAELTCPKCGVELTLPPKGKEGEETKEEQPSPGEEPVFNVGSGFVE